MGKLLVDVAEETNDSNEDIGHTSRIRHHDKSEVDTHVHNKSKISEDPTVIIRPDS